MAEEKDELLEEDTRSGKFMTFWVGDELYGINISYVNQIIMMQSITAIPEAVDYVRGMINLRGRIITVIDVRVRFKMEPIEYTDKTCIIIINVLSKQIGLIVEKIAEVDDISDDEIVPPPALGRRSAQKNKYVYGLARTEHSVKLLLDPEKLIEEEVLDSIEDISEEYMEEIGASDSEV